MQRGWRPSKSLGQNFLVEGFYINNIIEKSRITRDDHILEIGAGLGNLTLLLAQKARKVTAIEKDPFLITKLKAKIASEPSIDNIELLLADALNFPFTELEAPVKVIGNLPYSIATSIILRLIEVRQILGAIYITIQKEVAEKILGQPGGKDYGSLSLFVQYYLEGSILFVIPAEAFRPKPKIDSAFVCLYPRLYRPALPKDETMFFHLVRNAFSYRRKTLWNNLKQGNFLSFTQEDWQDVFTALQLDPKVRAQDLSMEAFVRLSNAIKDNAPGVSSKILEMRTDS